MIVAGWDPGFGEGALGFGILEFLPASSRVLEYGAFGEAAGDRHEGRLDRIAEAIDGVLNKWCPDVMGYEQQATVHAGKDREGQHATFSSKRVHEVTGMLRQAARSCLAEPIPCYSPATSTIKVAVIGKGGGHAVKGQVQLAVRRLFGVRRCSSHEADAIATAVATLVAHRKAQAVEAQLQRRQLALIR